MFFFTCRCGRPEKAWEAREDIRHSERSIFRRFGRAWKINQSYQCGGVQFFSCFYTFHRNSVEGLRDILSGFMTKCVLFLIIARCLVCFFIFNIDMNYSFQLLFDKKWSTSASDSLVGLFPYLKTFHPFKWALFLQILQVKIFNKEKLLLSRCGRQRSPVSIYSTLLLPYLI